MHTGNPRALQISAKKRFFEQRILETRMRYQHPEPDIVREALNAPRTMTVQ
jgi:hypothetical protein